MNIVSSSSLVIQINDVKIQGHNRVNVTKYTYHVDRRELESGLSSSKQWNCNWELGWGRPNLRLFEILCVKRRRGVFFESDPENPGRVFWAAPLCMVKDSPVRTLIVVGLSCVSLIPMIFRSVGGSNGSVQEKGSAPARLAKLSAVSPPSAWRPLESAVWEEGER